MNTIIPFNDYKPLNEGISPLLYHFTYPSYTLHMLAENRIHCSSTLGTSSDRRSAKGNFFYFSMQTTKNSRLGYGGAKRDYKGDGAISGGRNVCWVIDGTRLQERYSGKPFSYLADLRDRNTSDGDEMEERVILDKPYIENADKYIKEIHIGISRKEKYDERLVELCASRNISLYYYTDAIAFENHWKEKAVDLSTIESFRSEEDDNDATDQFKNRDVGTLIALLCYKDEANKVKLMAQYPNNVFPEYVQERIDYYQRVYFNNPYNLDELGRVAEGAIKNNRSTTTPVFRFAISLLTTEMHKMGVPNITEYLYRKSGHRKAPVASQVSKTQPGLYYDGYLKDWSDRAWKYLDFYEVYDILPVAEADHAFDNKFKNDDVSILTVYNFLVKKIGKGKTHQFFKKNDLEIIKPTTW